MLPLVQTQIDGIPDRHLFIRFPFFGSTTTTATNSPFRRRVRRQVKKINQAVLPLRYSQRFYQDLLQPPLAALCRVATVVTTTTTTSTANDDGQGALVVQDSRVIGALCVAWNTTKKDKKTKNATGASIVQEEGAVVVKRDDDNDEDDEDDGELWIMTLAVLAPYRSQGIGSRLLQSLLRACCTSSETGRRQQQLHGGGGDRGRTITRIRLHVQTSNEDAIRFYTAKFGFVHDGTVTNYYPRLDPPDCHLLVKKILVDCDHHHHHHGNNNAPIIHHHHQRTSPNTLSTTVASEIMITPRPVPKKQKVRRDEE
jgi:ribosomal protein S18 acetylase RimI-like enzyme